jgi:hypothetical protein
MCPLSDASRFEKSNGGADSSPARVRPNDRKDAELWKLDELEAVRVERRIALEGWARNTPSIEPKSALSCSCHLADAFTDRSTSSKMLAAMPSSNSPLLPKCQ